MSNQEKTHVTILINDLAVGGAQRLIADQLQFFDRSTYTYSLVTLFQFPQKADFYDSIPTDVRVYRYSFSSFYDVRSWFSLWKTLRHIQPDIVVSHLFFANTVGRLLKIVCGYVSIAVEHNTYTTQKTRLHRLVDTLLARLTARIVAVSETVASFTAKQERIPREQFVVIHNGVDLEKLRTRMEELPPPAEVKAQLGFSPHEKIIVSVGRLTPQKNHALLIEAFATFLVDHPEYRLVILGEGGERRALEEKRAAHNCVDTISLPGYADPVPYYVAGEFLVLTSAIEGFALVGIEAMACGMPMVSTRTAGPDEYLQDGVNGFFIEDARVDAVVNACEKMVAHPSSWGDATKHTAAQFDIQSNVEKYEQLFADVMQS